ncbi:hypothetical protein LINPERHAP1_LOCUS37518 [Linum perenne]
MMNELAAAYQGPAVKFDDIVKVLDGVLLEYETLDSSAKFNQPSFTKSVLGPIFEHFKKVIHTVLSEKDVLMSKCCTLEEKAELLQKTLEASEKFKSEYQSRYEDAVKDMNSLSHHYKNRMTEMKSNCLSLEDKCSSLHEMLDGVKQESLNWKFKYEDLLTEQNDFKKGIVEPLHIGAVSNSSVARRHSWCPESKDSADQAQLALVEARQWKDKYELAVNEAQVATEKAEKEVKSLIDQATLREEALRTEFSNSLGKKDEEVKIWMAKLEEAGQRLNTLTLEAQAAEEKIQAYDTGTSNLKLQCKELNDKYESVKASVQSLENEARIKLQERVELEQKYLDESKRFEEIQVRCKLAEEELSVAQTRLQEKIELEQKYLDESKRLEEIQVRCKLAEEKLGVAQTTLQEKNELEQKYLDDSKRLEEIQIRCKLAEEKLGVAQTTLQEKNELEQKYLDDSKRLEEIQIRCKLAEEKLGVAQTTLQEKNELEQKYLDDSKRLEEIQIRCKLAEEKLSVAQTRLQEKIEVEQKYFDDAKRLEEIQIRCKLAEEKLGLAQTRLQEKIELEQKYLADLKRLHEIEAKCQLAEEEVNVAQLKLQEKIELEHKYLAELEKLRETHESVKIEVTNPNSADSPGIRQVALLQEMLKERDQEIGQLKTKCEALENIVGPGGVNHSPFEPDSLEAKLQSIQQHLYSEDAEVDETILSNPSKREWLEVATPVESFISPESLASDGGISRKRKRQKGYSMSLQKCTSTEVGSESSTRVAGEEDDAQSQKPRSVSYSRLTMARMRQELNEGGYGGELLKQKGAKKKDIYALYLKHILKN